MIGTTSVVGFKWGKGHHPWAHAVGDSPHFGELHEPFLLPTSEISLKWRTSEGDVQPSPGDFLTAGQCNTSVAWHQARGAVPGEQFTRPSAAFSIPRVLRGKHCRTEAHYHHCCSHALKFPITRAGRVSDKHIESSIMKEKKYSQGYSPSDPRGLIAPLNALRERGFT